MIEVAKSVTEAFRPIGAMEEFFFLLRQIYSPTIVVGVEIIGAIQPMRLKAALDKVCLQSPHLQARARRKGQSRPHFFTAYPPSVASFDILPLGPDLNTIFGEQMIKSFPPEDAPVRAILLAGEQSSVLVVSADHMMLDGRGLVYLIEDILEAATDSDPARKASMSLSQDTLLGLDVASGYESGAIDNLNSAPVVRAALPVPIIENVEISGQEMVDLRQLARMGGTTFHALLTATILETGRLISKSWQNRPVTFTSIVDNRPLFDEAARLGCYISFASGEYPASGTPFLWEQAAVIRKGITEQATRQAVAQQIVVLQDALAMNVQPKDGVNLVGAYDLLVTNYGQVNIKREFGGLAIQKLMPHVISPGNQTVSVATVGHDLYMSNVSFEPIPQLLVHSKERLLGLLPG